MLQHSVAVYVPTTVAAKTPAHASLVAEQLRHVKTTMAKLFGGYTATPGHGGWVSDVHGLIEEPVTVVESHHGPDAADKVPLVFDLARRLARTMGQEAVSVRKDGVLHFVEPTGDKK